MPLFPRENWRAGAKGEEELGRFRDVVRRREPWKYPQPVVVRSRLNEASFFFIAGAWLLALGLAVADGETSVSNWLIALIIVPGAIALGLYHRRRRKLELKATRRD